MSLSDSLVYSPKPSAVSSSKARWNQPSYNKSTFNPGEVIMLNIPTGRRGSFLNTRMSYLKFRVKNKSDDAAKTIAPDYNIASIFSRFELYHGSNLLEQIHDYGLLVNLWHDMCGSSAAHGTTGNLLEGQGTSIRTGEAIAGDGASRVFCVPLLSGIVGVLQSKYLPTGDMTAGDLRLELTLANATTGVVTAGADAPSYEVNEVELMLEYTDLASDAARMVSQSNSGGYMISFDSFANYQAAIETGAASANILIPARYSSLKTLFTVFRISDNIVSKAKSSISERSNPFAADNGQWYYSIGGKNIPSTPVKTNTEAAAEMCKALHAFGAQSHTSLITRATWSAKLGTYIIAADLESQPHKSKLSESGINTLSTNTYLIAQFPAENLNYTVSTFAHYDGILIVQGGLASVQF